MGAAAIPIMMGISAAMTAVGGVVAYQDSKKAAKAQEQLAAQEALEERQQSAADASDANSERKRRESRQIAQLASLGADAGTGSALDIIFNTAAAGERDEVRILHGGQRRAVSAEQRGAVAAADTRARGKSSLISGFGQAVSQGASAAQAWYG